MNPAISNRLHLIRWMSAIVVLLGHIEMVGRWRTGVPLWPEFYQMAHLAVMSFFVLSGYIIAHVSTRTRTLSQYLQDRCTRIYIVLVPAVLLTVLLDQAGSFFNSSFYNLYSAQSYYALRFVLNVLGMQGWQGYRVQLGTNSPLWSIGYEMFFYLVFGFLFYKVGSLKAPWTGEKKVYLAMSVLLSVLVGLKMMLYIFIWLLGAGVYWIGKKIQLPAYGYLLALAICLFAIFSLPAGYLMDMVFAIGVATVLLTRCSLVIGKSFNRQMADFSYSLYAIHLPVIFFIYGVFWRPDFQSTIFAVATGSAAIFLAMAFSHVFERRRYLVREMLKILVQTPPQKHRFPDR